MRIVLWYSCVCGGTQCNIGVLGLRQHQGDPVPCITGHFVHLRVAGGTDVYEVYAKFRRWLVLTR